MAEPNRLSNGRFAAPVDLEERVRLLELDSQKNESNLTNHTDVCGERYKGIADTMARIEALATKTADRVEQLVSAQDKADGVAEEKAEAARPKWWIKPAAILVSTIIGAVMGLIGWMGGQLYSDNLALINARAVATASAPVKP